MTAIQGERILDKLPAWYTDRLQDYEYLGYTFAIESDGGWHTCTVSKDEREVRQVRGLLLGYVVGEALWMAEEDCDA